ncbi:site-specific DNA-methyltransferase [Rhodopirellula bahusiensis]|uniref:site-specific DNA-methyltransferase (adenine-specific) n=2 Tax=Rhodopirellula bahusiensis TaxID=2014065 RepID=A0A2G1W6W4_9BACT|nr:site-specific DNA-methyltransferase [Rhodopirellula bahusiensis]
MARKQKLELTWIGKETRPKLEPRIFLEDSGWSYHASHRVGDSDLFDNRLIFGDNLLALKALEQEFSGKVKCIYIDPPFNTQQAFEHYDDCLENSLWLTLMAERLHILRGLLSEDGLIWIHLDDNQVHRCKCVCDEIFGPDQFISSVIWEKSDSPRMDADFFSSRHDTILVFAKNRDTATINRFPADDDDIPEHYNRTDDSNRRYYTKPLRAMGGQGDTRKARPNLYFGIEAPDGSMIYPKKQDGTDGAWRWGEEKVKNEADRIEWVDGRNGWTPYYRIYAENRRERPPETIWFHEDVGSNRTSKAEVKKLLPKEVAFGTPKPEKLLERVIHISTNPGDCVLDSFAGSGTTGAVAHKMGRRWVMVELGEHCHTHLIPRLREVIDGNDQGGVSSANQWKGGGGFRYYTLGPSLLEEDEFGNWIINKKYNPEMLAEAMCKLEGFTYAPSTDFYWQHGHSTETDFIYVTTQTLTREQLVKLSDEVGPNRSLLICCGAYRIRKVEDFPNLTLKKIPLAVMSKCEWGKDDYSLEIKALPDAPEPEPDEFEEVLQDLPKNKRKARKVLDQQASLFALEDAE